MGGPLLPLHPGVGRIGDTGEGQGPAQAWAAPGLGFPTCNTKERVGLGASEGSSERRCPEPSWYPLIARAHARLDPPDPHASVHCPRPSAALGDGGHSGHASGTTSVPPRQPLMK